MRQVDLLVTGELKKQVERSFKAAKIDDQRSVGLALGVAAQRPFAIRPPLRIIIGRNHIVSLSLAHSRVLTHQP